MTRATELLLVHGSWGSPEMWRFVVDALGDADFGVRIADLPSMNRAGAVLADDVAHVRSLATASPVVLCGHSYGGTVITAAATALGNVVHLIYVAGFALEVGESSRDWYAKRPPTTSVSLTELGDGRDIPTGWGDEDGTYSGEAVARIRSVQLRPQTVFTPMLTEAPAWRHLPSTYVVATRDRLIHPDNQREMGARAGARIIEIDAGHLVNLAAPVQLAGILRDVMSDLAHR